MRILFVSPQIPWPLDVGSRIRTYQLLRAYAELGDVTAVCFGQPGENFEPLQPLVASATVVAGPVDAEPESGLSAKLAALGATLRPRPRMLSRFDAAGVRLALQDTLKDSFDVVHVSRLAMCPALIDTFRHAALRDALRILDLDDLESHKMHRLAMQAPPRSLRRSALWYESRKLARYERSVFRAFDRVLVCSPVDRSRVEARSANTRVDVFANGCDVPCAPSPPAAGRDEMTVLYLGAMGYPPNEDAVMWFVSDVFPLIRRTIPGARLIIAGGGASERIKRFDGVGGIEWAGYVTDALATMGRATVCIVPLRLGGGTRIKILEAMAVGTPVVSTAVGCEGLDVIDGEHLLVANSAEAFAQATVSLLQNPVRREALAQAARRRIEATYLWSQIRSGFVSELKQALAPRYRLQTT